MLDLTADNADDGEELICAGVFVGDPICSGCSKVLPVIPNLFYNIPKGLNCISFCSFDFCETEELELELDVTDVVDKSILGPPVPINFFHDWFGFCGTGSSFLLCDV